MTTNFDIFELLDEAPGHQLTKRSLQRKLHVLGTDLDKVLEEMYIHGTIYMMPMRGLPGGKTGWLISLRTMA